MRVKQAFKLEHVNVALYFRGSQFPVFDYQISPPIYYQKGLAADTHTIVFPNIDPPVGLYYMRLRYYDQQSSSELQCVAFDIYLLET